MPYPTFTKMKTIITILVAILSAIIPISMFAQPNKSNDYNLQKAYEILREEEDAEKALEYVNKQLSDTPDNVSALLLRVKRKASTNFPGYSA